MPCVQFTTEGNKVQAEITFHTGGDVFNTAYLLDTCHQALIHTLGSIWPDWIDYDQYMAKLHARQETL